MDQEIAQVAQALTNFLSPALPHLLDVGKKVAVDAGKQVTSAALAQAKALWTRLGPAVEERPAAAEAAADVAATPEDADAQASLRLQLKKILAGDEELAKDVIRLLRDAPEATAYGATVHGNAVIAQGPGAVAAGSVAVSGDVHGDVVAGNRRES